MPRFSGCDAGSAPIPEKRQRHRNARPLGKVAHLVHRSGNDDAVAGENHRPLGVVNQAPAPVRIPSGRAKGRDDIRGSWGLAASQSKSHVVCCASFVMSTSTGPGRPDSRHIKGFADRACATSLGVGHQIVVLGDGQRDPGDVGFLKGVGADQLAAHLSGDADDRRRIEHGCGNSRDHVGRAGSRSRDGDAHLPAGARVTVGHVRRSLLVAHQDVMDVAALAARRRLAESLRRDNRTHASRPRARGIPRECLRLSCFLPAVLSFIATFPLFRSAVHGPKKQNPPSQCFWRGGIREPSGFLCSQLTASLHTGTGASTGTLKTTTRIRCRSRLCIDLWSGGEMVSKANARCKGKVRGIIWRVPSRAEPLPAQCPE